MARHWLLAAVVAAGACNEDSAPGDSDGSTGGEASTGAQTDSMATDDGTGTDGVVTGTDTDTDGEPLTCDEAPVITYNTFGRGFLATYCNGCHGGAVIDRQNAPPEVVFDTEEQASAFAERILSRSIPAQGVQPMPPNGGIVVDDIERLAIWLTCYP